jgi:hypothetical protein
VVDRWRAGADLEKAQPAAAGEPSPAASAVVFHNLGGAASCFGPAEDQYRTTWDTEKQRMRGEKVAPFSAVTDPRIAKIEQMTLEEITAFTSRMMTEIVTGKVTPKEARAIDRAVGKRLKVIEQDLKAARISL